VHDVNLFFCHQCKSLIDVLAAYYFISCLLLLVVKYNISDMKIATTSLERLTCFPLFRNSVSIYIYIFFLFTHKHTHTHIHTPLLHYRFFYNLLIRISHL